MTNYLKDVLIKTINSQILSAVLAIAGMTIIVKFLSFFKEIIVAWKFGTGSDLDAFLIALVIPSFMISVISGAFNAAFIPIYIRIREKKGIDIAQQFFSEVTCIGAILLIIASIAIVQAAHWYLPKLIGGFSAEKLKLTLNLLYVLSPVIFLNGMVIIWGAILNADKHFRLVALSPSLTALSTIIFVFFMSKLWGIYALTIGLVVGVFFEFITLGIAVKSNGFSLRPRWFGNNDYVLQFMLQYLVIFLGSLLMSSTTLIDRAMAAGLDSGSVAALNYGERAIASLSGLGATALGTAMIPYFSQMIACNDWKQIKIILNRYLKMIFIFGLLGTVLIIIMSEPLIQFLFQRGSFTAENTHLVAKIQSCYALQLPFYLASVIMSRLVSSLLANQILAIGTIINVAVNIGLNFLFIQKIGIAGIALSTSFVYIISFAFLFFYWTRVCNKKIAKSQKI
ncbi:MULTISPECIES: lipid II flippase MurJ [Spirulina sp. CCY15215]|uniref:murein biosynthesis integral membrane protein MurJ n=1 Tax=Spirulina sp. CCY15215 TaxID=2767591 RepID=UPI00194E7081